MSDQVTEPSDESELIFLPLGGSAEIGMNLNLYGYRGKWLMVDCGVSFGNDTMPGIDVYMADPAFIAERKKDLLGIVLTHAHEDHIGAVHHLWRLLNCPVYATPFTAALLRSKLEEAGLLERVTLHEVDLGSRFKIGPFGIEMVTVTHSLPEPNALAIRTPAGMVLHTGDWKLDPKPLTGKSADEKRLAELGAEGVLAVIGDSTNVFVEGSTGSEADVRQSLIALFGAYSQRIIVGCFASNVARVESIARAAQAHGREVALFGRSLRRIDEAARELGYLKGIRPFLDERDAEDIAPERLVAICTGSQGEPRAALARIAEQSHPRLTLDPGDVCIFSSRIIPGNEQAIFDLQEKLIRQGVEIVTEKEEFIHVSGHPARDDMARLYAMLKPKLVVPVHGEARHLREHGKFARELGYEAIVVENGDMLRLGPGAPRIFDHVDTGRLALDGKTLVPMQSDTLKQRRRLATDGSALVTLVLDSRGRLQADPQIATLGLVDGPEDPEFHAAMIASVREAIDDLPASKRANDDAVGEAARLAVRRHFDREQGKRPPTKVHLVRL